jgi:hypothetical protein
MAASQGPVLVSKGKRSALEEALSLTRDPHPDRFGDRVAIIANEDRSTSWDASKLEVPVSELKRLAKVNHMGGTKPSIARRLLRIVSSFLIAASIGVGATLAWQRYGEETDKVVKSWAAAWLQWASSFSTVKSPSHGDITAERSLSAVKSPPHIDATVEQSLSAAAQVSADETAPPQVATPISGQISSEVMQQLEIAARNLAALQHSIAELAAKQEEMSSNIAKLQAADRENRQKIASVRKKVLPAPSPAPTSPQTTAPQPSSMQLSSTPSEIRPAPIPRPPSILRQ